MAELKSRLRADLTEAMMTRDKLRTATLRMLLEHERAKREELAQEVARLRAGLVRQNERIVALEREIKRLVREEVAKLGVTG